MKTTIILNNIKVQKEIPTSWEEVTFQDFLNLDACESNKIKLISLFTGVAYETLLKAKILDMDNVLSKLGFLAQIHPILHPTGKLNPETVRQQVPRKILGYDIPKDLEYEEVQQYLDLNNYSNEINKAEGLDKLRKYTLLCAVYACKAKHGKYDYLLAEPMADEFLKAPCTEVVALGNFTLMKLIGLNLNINLTSQRQSSLWKKFRLVLTACRLRMAHRLPLTIL